LAASGQSRRQYQSRPETTHRRTSRTHHQARLGGSCNPF
jgi:hypothetical protein